MADIFISYSRKDIEFVRALYAGLQRHGLDAWVDWEGIPPSVAWLQEIFAAIDTADIFLFIISPDSVASRVSQQEIEHALARNKRIIPIMYRSVDHGLLHPGIAQIHSFPFGLMEFERSLEQLVTIINTDFAWIRIHTRLQVRALEWESKHQDNSLLLRGTALREAEAWLEQARLQKISPPTALHTQYIHASRKAAHRAISSVVGILLALVLVVSGSTGLIIIKGRTAPTSPSLDVQSTNVAPEDGHATAQAPTDATSTPTIPLEISDSTGQSYSTLTQDFAPLRGTIAFAEGPSVDGPFHILVALPGDKTPFSHPTSSKHDAMPAWSRDGAWIAFAADVDTDPLAGIYKMHPDGTERSAISTNITGWHPTWSPDGAQVAFCTGRVFQNTSSIYIANSNGTGQIQITDSSSYDMDPAWSPDGTRIAFASLQNGKVAIYTMKPDGTAPQLLIRTSENVRAPAWSPNGKEIAFQSCPDPDGAAGCEIYKMPVDGSGPPTPLTNSGANISPTWSPYGSYIAFQSERPGDENWQIYVMREDGAHQEHLFAARQGYDADPAWGP